MRSATENKAAAGQSSECSHAHANGRASTLTSAAAKAKLVAARGDDTIRTRVFDIVRNLNWPAMYTGRALQNARQWHGRETELEKRLPTEAPRYARAAEGNDFETSVVFAGECVDLIRNVKPAAAIVALIVHRPR